MSTNLEARSEQLEADLEEARQHHIARREDAEKKRGNPTPLLGALMGEVFGK